MNKISVAVVDDNEKIVETICNELERVPAALFPGRIIGGLYETHKRNHDRGSLPDGTQLLRMYRFWHLLYVPGRCAGI